MEILFAVIREMSPLMVFYSIAVLLVSIGGFLLMGFDKYRAKKGQDRISELTFMALAFFGGAIGILLGMVSFHHKISKKKFYVGIPILYLANQLFHLIILYRIIN
ncbi:DUF1294 domain-containing protein [Alkaliphilus transvaalensis]|uniref:DUF1294 domain-containing protein n=1 Tax=Alkaliphilus transvaalensis TaxID=114628 RepID=UPI00047E5024|nr:DUF1294 domain-containing protein [Alkaliphilus transvaalensis]